MKGLCLVLVLASQPGKVILQEYLKPRNSNYRYKMVSNNHLHNYWNVAHGQKHVHVPLQKDD